MTVRMKNKFHLVAILSIYSDMHFMSYEEGSLLLPNPMTMIHRTHAVQGEHQFLYDLSLEEMRALTNQRVKFVLSLPVVKHVLLDQEEKRKSFISQILILGEVLCMVDVSMSIKCGILFLLFGGAISNLGSPEHVTKWFWPLKEQKYTGMFAMTERGHGSNVRGIQTEATFDLDNQEFVIDMPCENAHKMYIGNAMHGNYAAVFAQLIIEGKSQGPHCFIVPIRDENGNLYPGVTAIDMMHKEGMNGVDNGILIFDKVRIPRENLLDKFGSVTPDGQYHSPIQSKNARFNAILATLTPSRLAVTFQALGAMKLGLMIAIRYSHRIIFPICVLQDILCWMN